MQTVVTAAKEMYCQNTPLGEKKIQWQVALSQVERVIFLKHCWLLQKKC